VNYHSDETNANIMSTLEYEGDLCLG